MNSPNSDSFSNPSRDQKLQEFLTRYNLNLDVHLLDQATTHDSYLSLDPNKTSNERLENIGDAVIDLLAADWLYDECPIANEALLTQLRSELVENLALGHLAKLIGLDQITLAGKKAQINEKQLADSLEAIFGAIFKQHGYDACKKPFFEFFGPGLEQIKANQFQPSLKGKNQNNPKNYVQEYLQKRGYPRPKVELIEETGPPHKKNFVSKYSVLIENEVFSGIGRAMTKKESEVRAAAALMKQLKEKFHHQ